MHGDDECAFYIDSLHAYLLQKMHWLVAGYIKKMSDMQKPSVDNQQKSSGWADNCKL